MEAARCTRNQVDPLEDFKLFVDRLTLDWITNMGEELVDRQYEFTTGESDLVEKLRYLTKTSKRLDDESAFWELFHCESCEAFSPDLIFHVRLSG